MAAALRHGHRYHLRGDALGIRSETAGGQEGEPDDGSHRAVQQAALLVATIVSTSTLELTP